MLEWLLAYYFVSSALPVDRLTCEILGEGCPSSKNVLGCFSKISGMMSSSISYFRVPNYRYFISIFLGLELALNRKFHLFSVK